MQDTGTDWAQGCGGGRTKCILDGVLVVGTGCIIGTGALIVPVGVSVVHGIAIGSGCAAGCGTGY